MERDLAARLHVENEFERAATTSPALSCFPSALGLVAYLHTHQETNNGNPSKDRVLGDLLGRALTQPVLRDLLLLAFVPMLHSLSRQVSTQCPALSRDDIAQQVVREFLELLASEEFLRRESHIAFAISRLLRRNTFTWAERESRGFACGKEATESAEASRSDGPEPIERAALLRHFLHRSRKRGVLSADDLEFLVECKPENSGNGTSNASRQRMKRLLAKLRRVARSKPDNRQMRLF
jgi:hypothetical protein